MSYAPVPPCKTCGVLYTSKDCPVDSLDARAKVTESLSKSAGDRLSIIEAFDKLIDERVKLLESDVKKIKDKK